jgi:hypothetical protein
MIDIGGVTAGVGSFWLEDCFIDENVFSCCHEEIISKIHVISIPCLLLVFFTNTASIFLQRHAGSVL